MIKVVFRVDASLEIGSGHVMRCLTLAGALKEQGAEVFFICRNYPGNLILYIESKGYQVFSLASLKANRYDSFKAEKELFHAHWLGVTQEQDAKECEAILEKMHPDWLIVDHYAIDSWWQSELKGLCKKLMVIDDLADRRHECDLLLDQTFGRKEEDYKSLVNKDCQLLIGSKYALLRPEFSQWREFSLRRRATNQELKKLLITMGGVDSDNVTGQVLEILKACGIPKELIITVIIGSASPNIKAVKRIVETMPYKTEVKVNVTNMAELMADTDLAIGAAGTTTWERCCLGLPTLMIVLADNQKIIASLIEKAGAAIKIDGQELESICKNLLLSLSDLQGLSLQASHVTDGQGVNRVIESML